jgi:hypothetical protein
MAEARPHLRAAIFFGGVSIWASLVRRLDESEDAMRFMMIVIPKGYATAAPSTMPPADLVAKMTKYNDDLKKAGVLLALDGLHPQSTASRVKFGNGKPIVVDGPFAEAKEAIGGYWLIQVKSQEEAVEWARRAPMLEGDMIEVRRVQEMEDFPADVQAALR